ncbi:hypothetical protein [Streptomyces sp. NPDC007905]
MPEPVLAVNDRFPCGNMPFRPSWSYGRPTPAELDRKDDDRKDDDRKDDA